MSMGAVQHCVLNPALLADRLRQLNKPIIHGEWRPCLATQGSNPPPAMKTTPTSHQSARSLPTTTSKPYTAKINEGLAEAHGPEAILPNFDQKTLSSQGLNNARRPLQSHLRDERNFIVLRLKTQCGTDSIKFADGSLYPRARSQALGQGLD